MVETSHTGDWDTQTCGGPFREIADFATCALDPARVEYFQGYLDDYFSDAFVEGMGTEHILGLLESHGRGRRWLDLGAGTSTLFWALATSGISQVVCCDISVEALAVLSTFVRSESMPRCYADVLAMCGKPPDYLSALRKLDWRYWAFDALADWPNELAALRFDMVTAFGHFGISGSHDAYRRCFGRAAAHLSPRGCCIGADWIRRPECVPLSRRDYGCVSEELVAEAGREAGLTVHDCRTIHIVGDPIYETVVAWAMEKPGPGPGA